MNRAFQRANIKIQQLVIIDDTFLNLYHPLRLEKINFPIGLNYRRAIQDILCGSKIREI